MNTNDKSNLFLPNIFCRNFLEALEDLAGKNGLSTILNLASLHKWNDALPPDNFERMVDFADFTRINLSLEELFGIKGGQSLSRQAGWSIFDHSLGAIAEAIEGTDDGPSPEEMFHLALKALADLLSEISDIPCTFEISQNVILISITNCPVCWGRDASSPTCSAILGIIERNLNLFGGGTNFVILEEKCIATGDSGCVFSVRQNHQK